MIATCRDAGKSRLVLEQTKSVAARSRPVGRCRWRPREYAPPLNPSPHTCERPTEADPDGEERPRSAERVAFADGIQIPAGTSPLRAKCRRTGLGP